MNSWPSWRAERNRVATSTLEQTIPDGGMPVATVSICESPGRLECRVGSPAPDMGPASPSQRSFQHGTGPGLWDGRAARAGGRAERVSGPDVLFLFQRLQGIIR